MKQLNEAAAAVADSGAAAAEQANSQENKCVNDYCSVTGEYCSEWNGATLRRIPYWGSGP